MYKRLLCAIIMAEFLFNSVVNVQAEELEETYEEFLCVIDETPIVAEKENKIVEEEIYVGQYSEGGVCLMPRRKTQIRMMHG